MKTKFEVYEENGHKFVHQFHTENNVRDLKVRTDEEGNKYFHLFNPYYNYSKSKTKFKNHVDSSYKNYPHLAYQMVCDDYADTIVGHPAGLFAGTPYLLAIVYLDRAVGEQKRKEFDETWSKNLVKFSWGIKYYTGGFDDYILRDENFDIMKFDSEKEVKSLIRRVKKETKAINAKLEEMYADKDHKEEYEKYFDSILDRNTDDRVFDSLVFAGIKDPESDRPYNFDVYPCSIPVFKEEA